MRAFLFSLVCALMPTTGFANMFGGEIFVGDKMSCSVQNPYEGKSVSCRTKAVPEAEDQIAIYIDYASLKLTTTPVCVATGLGLYELDKGFQVFLIRTNPKEVVYWVKTNVQLCQGKLFNFICVIPY